jgi:hypothetical protein
VSPHIIHAARLDSVPSSRNTLLLEDTRSHPLLAFSEVSDNTAVTDDVFGIVQGENLGPIKSLVNVRSLDDDMNTSLKRTYASMYQRNEQARRRFELYSRELSFRASNNCANSLPSIVIGESASDPERAEHDRAPSRGVLEQIDKYAASKKSPTLVLVSTSSVDSSQVLSKYATAAHVIPRVKRRPTPPTYDRRSSNLACRLIMKNSLTFMQ